MTLAKAAVAWSGGLISFWGVLYVVATVRLLVFSELTALSPTAHTDVRVMYGAFQLAPGIFMLASLKREEWLEPALALATIMFVCVPAVRVFGMVSDGAANFFHFLALFIELGTCAWPGSLGAGSPVRGETYRSCPQWSACSRAAQQAAEADGRGLQPRGRPCPARTVVGSRAAAA
jgi:hypothetical protein